LLAQTLVQLMVVVAVEVAQMLLELLVVLERHLQSVARLLHTQLVVEGA
jgi:hypothetical protein